MKPPHALAIILISIVLFSPGRPTGVVAAERPATPGMRYGDMLNQLRTELVAKLPGKDAPPEAVNALLASDALDAALVKFVVLHEATAAGLAEFARQGKDQEALVEQLLSNPELMKQMLVADGAREGRYGPTMQIYTDIQRASSKASGGVLQRLALAISLEHAVPVEQANPKAATDAPRTVDPVRRYLHYEQAYLGGELDPGFDQLTAWDLRFVVDGHEPDETLAWGRRMLRNFRPDHVLDPDPGWRYVRIVPSDVRYGSGDVKHDRPELQEYQNIIMNGGVCGRRAFFGRFILRAFGIPTTARPQPGHAALVHWTPRGWVPNLGGGWGSGSTRTRYGKDLDFLATTQARARDVEYLRVKRAQWIGDVLGERPVYGEHAGTPGSWYGASLRTQRDIIERSKAIPLAALGEELGESDEPTSAERVVASPALPEHKRIAYGTDGAIVIPAAAYSKPSGSTRDVLTMKSFDGGLQVFLPRFSPEGLTILRGGTWKSDPDACASGARLLSGGYGRYEDWGLRVAVSVDGPRPPNERKLDLGDGVTMELVLIKPGTFVMGGESTTDGRFQCVELPKHEVTLTRSFYLGKHEVTQAQYQAIMGNNPSRSTRAADCPVDNVPVQEAVAFCDKLAEKTGLEVRLPTEAEWEYAARAGTDTKWFFGNEPSRLGEYAWYKGNSVGKSHPVGQKKPNPWGLYDIHGNVCERVSDTYARDDYARGPRTDPTGPRQGTKSHLEYRVTLPRAGKYTLTAHVVTVNHGQRLNVSANDAGPPTVMVMPFTNGDWRECDPVVIMLSAGENTLRFFRDEPPQAGLAIKSFTLKPAP